MLAGEGVSCWVSYWLQKGCKRTGNGLALVQVVAGAAPEVDGDGALGGGLPGKVDGVAGLSVQALGRDVERVGAIGVGGALGGSDGDDGQDGGGGETHGVRLCMGWTR